MFIPDILTLHSGDIDPLSERDLICHSGNIDPCTEKILSDIPEVKFHLKAFTASTAFAPLCRYAVMTSTTITTFTTSTTRKH